MEIHGFGKDASDNYVDGSLDRLEAMLTYTEKLGYDLAEVSVPGLLAVANGKLLPQRVRRIKEVLSRYSLRYSVHAPGRSNLAYGYDHVLEKSVIRASIEFCYAIGAHRLVVHSGLQALDAARTGMVKLPDDAELARGVDREILALQELGPIAADAGVVIGLENGDPHLWECVALQQNTKLPQDLPKYHARLRMEPMIRQLESLNHPNIGMTLDLGHLHIAAHVLGDNYLEAVEQAAPWVRHLHISDNFGKLDVSVDREADRLPYGEADLHMPPGWGAIPFAEAFQKLSGYQGDVILEIKDLYWDHFGDALNNLREIVAALPGTSKANP